MSFYHYDPYAPLLSKVVRGFGRDLAEATALVEARMVDMERFKALVEAIPDSTYAKYPRLSAKAVRDAVDAFTEAFPDFRNRKDKSP